MGVFGLDFEFSREVWEKTKVIDPDPKSCSIHKQNFGVGSDEEFD